MRRRTATFADERDRRDESNLLSALSALGPHGAQMLDADALPTGERSMAQAFNAVLAQRDAERETLLSFLSDAAHQLRTPLAVLSARLQTPGAVDVERARADIAWMGRLVEQLLSSARTRVADPARMEPVDPADLGRDIVSALAPLAIYRDRDLAFDCSESEKERRTLSGNATLLFEALSNLVENALSHAPEGSTVLVRVGPGSAIHVLDRGTGVPESERRRIFERFLQGTSPTLGGAGLGLAIVGEVMRLHEGQITYTDRTGGGACFSMIFADACGGPW